MKRLHMHISVEDLEKSTKFYTALFGMEPTKLKEDYAQWLVDEPAVNLAISTGGEKKGLNHMGLQVDSNEAVQELEDRLQAAGVSGEKQKEAVCCYAKSNKYWVQDPDAIIWENYHTMEQAETFGGDSFTGGTGCCTPSFSTNGQWSTGGSC
ncbi:glyoxalase/bleomycin resistance/dioxygenase family protein [Sulfurimonas aquatica]|uniref:Glyoxalase/bleomycin resistance/dioxygenase family protein n=1 Tax=Sulfurimonas aquatica TaxID=2672570 RepID=A0A975AY11_9BACT|nr:ArsI/CadI family heavy metal resistance metalloenzyme [Sulfurimonas aquatica]QSZ40661.1 glyoxalase/bleomycin resistance/dioxygenase family protein [Sulfurimonas aquatica]